MFSGSQNKNTHLKLTALFKEGVAGNNIAYENFLNNIAIILRKIISKKIHQSEAEDVLQETLISIHKARHTYDGQRPLMPWLIAIAQFRINDHLRKVYSNSQRETVNIETILETLVDVTETGSDYEYIEELLNDLPEREKLILNMIHVEGYTAKEAGSKLGMKESAVKVAAHRAMKKIRSRFGI